jgi:hypothetical protein
MERKFIILDIPFAVPPYFDETPQAGSYVAFKGRFFKVDRVVYRVESKEIHIELIH